MGDALDQGELDALLRINGFLADEGKSSGRTLVEELQEAILDSGKLSLRQWKDLRSRLQEIERLIPHIDLIISLRERRADRKATNPG
ncbi:MAG: hypothetical protein J0M02_08945 [Planctomycetes bacterium]|jgi:hypothetical protein|nr:hypothetical protein [Planctomycetota bacterium]